MGVNRVMSLAVAVVLLLSVLLVHHQNLLELFKLIETTAAATEKCCPGEEQKQQQQRSTHIHRQLATNQQATFNETDRLISRRRHLFYRPPTKVKNAAVGKHPTLFGDRPSKPAKPVNSQFRPLRIAQIAPLGESVPPKTYGGTERMVYYLTEELVRLGHQVTLFCSADSQTSAQMVSHPSWPSLRLNPVEDTRIPYFWMLEQVRLQADQFDIMHFHTTEQLTMVQPFAHRTVTTLHGPLNGTDMGTLFECFRQVPFVSISDDQRSHLEFRHSNFVGTVHHGIPRDLLPFTAVPSSSEGAGRPYLAFLGRITESKRPDWAIHIAVEAGIPLRIAAKVDPVDVRYWKEVIEPLVARHSDLVQFVGEIDDSRKATFLGNALALLFPIDWSEPFGLVMIESMACGTPVVARRRGSVGEVVEHGVSGLIFETVEEGIEAVKEVHRLDRARIRETFERRFTVETMAQNYVKLYEKMRLQNEEEGKKVANS